MQGGDGWPENRHGEMTCLGLSSVMGACPGASSAMVAGLGAGELRNRLASGLTSLFYF